MAIIAAGASCQPEKDGQHFVSQRGPHLHAGISAPAQCAVAMLQTLGLNATAVQILHVGHMVQASGMAYERTLLVPWKATAMKHSYDAKGSHVLVRHYSEFP